MIKFILIIGFIANTQLVYCQFEDQKITNGNFQNYLVSMRDKVLSNNLILDENIDGTPYLNNNFNLGEIVTKDGVFKGVKMKYNIYDDAFLVDFQGKLMYLEPTSYVKKITIDGASFVVRAIPNSKNKYDFVIEKFTEQINLFSKKTTIFKKAEGATAIIATPKPATYLAKPDKYYLQLGSGPLVLVEKIKDFYQLFPNQADALKALIKTEKLEFKSENDLIKIIQFCAKNI
jgi:hypothetical protein